MLHADIEPEWFWLDMMIEELERTNCDILSAVVPFRDDTGITSTAIEDPADPWTVHLRLTVRQCHQLPETFTIHDCGFDDGRALLVNTGCWIARMGDWSKSFSGFSIRDRIIDTPDGAKAAQVESEDWRASREWQRMGLKVAATTKVQVIHHGNACWSNKPAWGAIHDPGSKGRLPVGVTAQSNGTVEPASEMAVSSV
jgi:hypothetical protein